MTGPSPMDLMERRALLHVGPNPDKQLDYIVTLTGHLPNSGQDRHIVLRYVPDRSVLSAKAFGDYLEGLSRTTWASPEDLAVTILTDVNNEIVARWAQVSLTLPDLNHHAVETHAVVLEDRQPGWDNPSLLGRLERI